MPLVRATHLLCFVMEAQEDSDGKNSQSLSPSECRDAKGDLEREVPF